MSYLAAVKPILSRSRESRTILACAGVLSFIALVAILGPLLSPHHYADANFENTFAPPSFEGWHLFGTDGLGRDLFVRVMMGVRITLFVAIIASAVSLGLGVAWGTIAGYVGGKVDGVMMRVVDVLYAMPFIFFVILLMVVFERSLFLILVAIGVVNWLDMARIVRGQTMSLKHREFVDAARLTGVSTPGIIARHITPNLFGVVVVYLTLTIPQAILIESFLSFLGLGIQAPQTSLGALVNDSVSNMEQAPWLLLLPASVLALILLCFNFLGDGLRETVDPRKDT